MVHYSLSPSLATVCQDGSFLALLMFYHFTRDYTHLPFGLLTSIPNGLWGGTAQTPDPAWEVRRAKPWRCRRLRIRAGEVVLSLGSHWGELHRSNMVCLCQTKWALKNGEINGCVYIYIYIKLW